MRMNKLWAFLSAGLLCLSNAAFAQEDAAVLPKGIFRVRGVGVATGTITQAYNNDGNRESLMHALNGQVVSTAKLASQNSQLAQLYRALNDLEPGLGDSLFQSTLQAKTEVAAHQYVFAAEYGLTSKLSLGLIVPTVDMSFSNTSFSATNQNNVAAIAARTKGLSGTTAGVNSFASQMPTTATYEAAVFTSKGYQTPHDFQFRSLGDIEMGVKYQFVNIDSGHFMMATKTGFRLPTTSHLKDYRNPLDRDAGDHQLDFASSIISQYAFDPHFSITGSAQYTHQFGDKRDMYVNAPGEDGLPTLDDAHRDQVQRKLGEKIDTELSASYGIADRQFTLYSAWQFNAKAQDMYSGSKGLNYAALQTDTRELAHRAEFGLGYSTIPLFQRKKFAVPLQAKVAYNTTLAGVNVSDAKYLRLDMIVYF